MATKTPIISVRNLVTRFGTQVVHDNLNLDIYQGEIFGIVGGSGSGKSVLLNTILGLQHPASGTVRILGNELLSTDHMLSLHLQSNWGVLFQGGALFSSLTVAENIQVPMHEMEHIPRDLCDELTLIKLRMVGLDESVFFKYPSELSGGMVKRVGLARALAVDPKILFLDEPTSGLDPIAAAAFDELIVTLRDTLNLTVVMITHDLDSIRRCCDRLGVLVDKHTVVGTLKTLLHNKHPWIYDYFHGIRGKIALAGIQD